MLLLNVIPKPKELFRYSLGILLFILGVQFIGLTIQLNLGAATYDEDYLKAVKLEE